MVKRILNAIVDKFIKYIGAINPRKYWNAKGAHIVKM
jgi:hypothetical protein